MADCIKIVFRTRKSFNLNSVKSWLKIGKKGRIAKNSEFKVYNIFHLIAFVLLPLALANGIL